MDDEKYENKRFSKVQFIKEFLRSSLYLKYTSHLDLYPNQDMPYSHSLENPIKKILFLYRIIKRTICQNTYMSWDQCLWMIIEVDASNSTLKTNNEDYALTTVIIIKYLIKNDLTSWKTDQPFGKLFFRWNLNHFQ